MNATLAPAATVHPLVQQATPLITTSDAAIPAAPAASVATAIPAAVPPEPLTSPSLTDMVTSALPGSNSAIIWSDYLGALGVLCFVIAALWFVLWFIKQRRYGGSSSRVPTMYIESRLALAPRKWVVVTRFQNKRFLLGLTDENITFLTELDVENANSAGDGKAFATALNQANTTL